MKVSKSNNIKFIPASHEDDKNPEVWKKVLLTRKDVIDGRIQMINWAKLPAGRTFQAHFHEDMQEIFIILTGKVKVRGGKEETVLEKGDAVVILPQIVHEMTNLVDHDVEYLVIGITQGNSGKTINV